MGILKKLFYAHLDAERKLKYQKKLIDYSMQKKHEYLMKYRNNML